MNNEINESSTVTNEQKVFELLKGAIPEKQDELTKLWKKYAPDIEISKDTAGITLNANKHRIKFDFKTLEVFWLIGFSSWKSIECYSPSILLSTNGKINIKDAIHLDDKLPEYERYYDEKIVFAQTYINAECTKDVSWPEEIPKVDPDRNRIADIKYTAVYDLILLAFAFAVLHEFRHVMFSNEKDRPSALHEEELMCDVWARSFLTSNLAEYAEKHSHDYDEVLYKRSMGMALVAFIIHEITPYYEKLGTPEYPSISNRVSAIINNTNLDSDSKFWYYTSSMLLGIVRKKHIDIDFVPNDAMELTKELIKLL